MEDVGAMSGNCYSWMQLQCCGECWSFGLLCCHRGGKIEKFSRKIAQRAAVDWERMVFSRSFGLGGGKPWKTFTKERGVVMESCRSGEFSSQ